MFILQKLCHKNSIAYFLHIYCIYAFFFVPLQANSFFAKNAYKIYTITQ